MSLVALRARYPAERGWVVLDEVSDDHATRRADVVAIDCWHGVAVGHEVKASRSDWLRELEDATKRDWIERVCQRRWIVATTRGIVLPAELPDGWGLLEAGSTGKLRRVVAAPPHQVPPLPLWLTRLLGKLTLSAERHRNEIVALEARVDAHLSSERERALAARERACAEREGETNNERSRLRQTWGDLCRLGEVEHGRSWLDSGALAEGRIEPHRLFERIRQHASEVVLDQARTALQACEALVHEAEAARESATART